MLPRVPKRSSFRFSRRQWSLIGLATVAFYAGWCLYKRYREKRRNQENEKLNVAPCASTEDGDDGKTERIPDPDILEIKIEDAVHGISSIQLLNLQSIIEHSLQDNWNFDNLQIEITKNGTTITVPFNLRNVASYRGGGTDDHNLIHCRFPVNLQEYTVGIRIRFGFKDQWSPFSIQKTLTVPSSLIAKRFKIKDRVTFVPPDTNQALHGVIAQIGNSEDNLFEIAETWIASWNVVRHHLVPLSRIYRNGPSLWNLIEIMSEEERMEKDKVILFGLNGQNQEDDVIMERFHALHGVFTEYVVTLPMDMEGGGHSITSIAEYLPFIGRFVAKEVIDFLIPNNRRSYHMVNCVMEFEHHFMKLVNVWRNSVENSIALGKPCNVHSTYSCDLCGMEVSRFDWMYRCNAELVDRHFFCLHCVWDIIRQNRELTRFLKEQLKEYLHDVCISEIVNYVCGAIVLPQSLHH